jgi:polysaccharide export outer membrane protein
MYRRKIKNLLALVLVIALISSCLNEKKITYFQKVANEKDTIAIAEAYIPKIQTGDILSIYVNSLSPEASSFFNPYSANSATSDAGGSGLSQTSVSGYLVGASGNIDLPLVGTISVNGLTTAEAHDLIKKRLEVFLKEPTVLVRFLNYKISILGEVNKPGVYVIPNEQVTLPEAITIAGDLTLYAKRNEIQIIRDVGNKKEFGTVDLTSREVFKSPYYFLHANDIIYIKAGKSKVAQSDLTFRILPLAVSVITAVILIITTL